MVLDIGMEGNRNDGQAKYGALMSFGSIVHGKWELEYTPKSSRDGLPV
jgi:hypothetical protein